MTTLLGWAVTMVMVERMEAVGMTKSLLFVVRLPISGVVLEMMKLVGPVNVVVVWVVHLAEQEMTRFDKILGADDFSRGGSGNDFIRFDYCSGVAYGDSGNDEIRGGDIPVELHGGAGHDILVSLEGGKLFGDDGDDTLRGCEVDTSLTGGKGADRFICGGSGSHAIITDFNAAEGDTKAEGCDNVVGESVSLLDSNDNNANTTETATSTSTPTSGVAEDSSATEEDASSLPGTTTATSSSNNSTETTEATGTAEIQKTIEVLPDEEPPQQEQQQQDQSQ